MGYWGYAPYVSVAARRKKAEKAAAKAIKAGSKLSPIAPYRGAVAKTFWGKAWCDNLEHYSDYANRLPRGRTYVRNGSVIDLNIAGGDIHAQVMGSSLYSVKVTVAEVAATHWKAIGTDCAGSIDSMVELLQGKLSKSVMERICKPQTGLFPAPKDIRFSCSCPDSASLCKHIAAVLYGVGARLDEQPELLFKLRKVDAQDLVAQAGTGLPPGKRSPASSRVLDEAALADVFGLEIDEGTPPASLGKTPPAKTVARKALASKPGQSTKPGKPEPAKRPKKVASEATKVLKPAKTPAVAKVAKKVAAKAVAKVAVAKTKPQTKAMGKPAQSTKTEAEKPATKTVQAAKKPLARKTVKAKAAPPSPTRSR